MLFRSRLTTAIATLALLFQLAVIPYHQALASGPAAPDAAAIAAELKASFGDAAALCIQTDGKGAPLSPLGDCDDHCPLCRFSAQAAAIVAPVPPALPERLDWSSRTLGAATETGAIPSRPARRNRARAPPFPV
jgi:hypothetical protein